MSNMTRRQFSTSLLAAGVTSAGLLSIRNRSRAVVIGGGVAGAKAATELRKAQPETEVLLIERDPRQLAGGGRTTRFSKPKSPLSLQDLQAAGITVALDDVTGVDWQAGRLTLFSGRAEAFDQVILAPGTRAVETTLPGYDARARHLWPAAWGREREAQRLNAQLSALPETGHVVLRLPAQNIVHPDVALTRAVGLSRWLQQTKPQARLTVLDSGAGSGLAQRFAQRVDQSTGQAEWISGVQILALDVDRGWIDTDAGRLRADVVNFIPEQGAGRIATLAGLVDASGWCPCNAQGQSQLNPVARIFGDARRITL